MKEEHRISSQIYTHSHTTSINASKPKPKCYRFFYIQKRKKKRCYCCSVSFIPFFDDNDDVHTHTYIPCIHSFIHSVCSLTTDEILMMMMRITISELSEKKEEGKKQKQIRIFWIQHNR